MIVRISEKQQMPLTSGTIEGVSISMYAVAAAVDTRLQPSDINPDQIQVKVLLQRRSKSNIIMQDNLLLLGLFNAQHKGMFEFIIGADHVAPASTVKHALQRYVNLMFGGPVRINAGDLMIIEVSVAKTGVVSSNVDSSSFYVEYEPMHCIGYETGLHQTIIDVVAANTTKQTFNLGDNVTAISFLNLDKNGHENPVVSNLSLASDRLDLSLSYNGLQARHLYNKSGQALERYGSTLPIHPTDGTGRVYRGADYLPQSVIILSGQKLDQEVDNARLDIAFNSANVASSANFVAYRKYTSDQTTLLAAEERQQKHLAENISKLPAVS